jgi:hypothetical protein
MGRQVIDNIRVDRFDYALCLFRVAEIRMVNGD